jgi:tRNA (cytidine/uridine-2'-O-)-methyltransferase
MPSPKRLFLVFGSETEGLPQSIRDRFPKSCYRIPINGAIRSLNLSTAAGIALYESLRRAGTLMESAAPGDRHRRR